MKSRKYLIRLKNKLSWPIVIRRVIGLSMAPTLLPNQIVIGSAWFKKIESNDIVIVMHYGSEKIKRVNRVTSKKVFLLGDNLNHSVDSRQFGWLSKDSITAKIIYPKKRKQPK